MKLKSPWSSGSPASPNLEKALQNKLFAGRAVCNLQAQLLKLPLEFFAPITANVAKKPGFAVESAGLRRFLRRGTGLQ